MLSIRFKNYGRALAAFIFAAFAPLAGAAANPVIDQAKAQCVVGEQADGYLGVVAGASASDAVRREIRDVNQQRKAAYANLAQRNGVSVEVTAALTAEKLIAQARPGHCVRDAQGAWTIIQ